MQKHARIRQERRRRHRFSFRSFHASASVVHRSSNVSLSFSFARDLCRDDDDDDDDDNKVVCSFVRDDDEAIALDIGRDIFSSKAEETRESSLTTRRSSQLVEYVCTRLSFFLSFFFVWDVFQFSRQFCQFLYIFFVTFFFRLVFKKNKCAKVTNERTNETYIKRKKEKNNKKNDRLQTSSYFSCSSFPWMEMTSRAVARRPIKPNSVVALNSLGVFVCIRILAFPKAAVRPVI